MCHNLQRLILQRPLQHLRGGVRLMAKTRKLTLAQVAKMARAKDAAAWGALTPKQQREWWPLYMLVYY